MSRKTLIEMLITSLSVGSYMFYGQVLMDGVALSQGWTASSYLYAAGAVIVLFGSMLIGKILTRGMK